jgi:uncharacterized protein YdeI (YjbR/CyaY-like superfamily)
VEDIYFFKTQKEFINWLEVNSSRSELWVGYYKKSTQLPSMTWSESVDVALCFGWIDGIRKSIDQQSYKIRFTPRKVKSVWSAVNVRKVEQLIKLNQMKPAGLDLFNKRSDKQGYTSEDRNIPLTTHYEDQIRANKHAWDFFTSLAPSYKRDSIWWVMSAKREETRLRRLKVLIESSQGQHKIPLLQKK